MIVTPFDPYSTEAAQDSGITIDERPLETQEADTETAALHRHLSSLTPIPPPISRPATPVPVGLSDKELARLRADTLTSQQPNNPQGSTLNVSQPTVTSSQTAVVETDGTALPYDTRRLHSEFESIRREMDRLRAEGLVIAAPPSYSAEGNG